MKQSATSIQQKIPAMYRKLNLAQSMIQAAADPNTAKMTGMPTPPADADADDAALYAQLPTAEEAVDEALLVISDQAIDKAIGVLQTMKSTYEAPTA